MIIKKIAYLIGGFGTEKCYLLSTLISSNLESNSKQPKKIKMKFVLCSVLIGTIFLISESSSSENDETFHAFHECSGIYLKNKGKVEYDVPTNKDHSNCMLVMLMYNRIVKNAFEKIVNKEIPNEATCVLTKFDESDTMDLVVKTAFVNTDSSLSPAEKDASLATTLKEADDSLEAILTKCGIDGDRLQSFMNKRLKE